MMSTNKEESKQHQSEAEAEPEPSPPSTSQPQKKNDETMPTPPRRPSSNGLGGDVVAPPSTASNTTVDSEACPRRLFKDDTKLIDTTTSQEGSKLMNDSRHPEGSSSNGIVIDRRPATITPIKKKQHQPSTTIVRSTSSPERHKITVSTISESNTSSITDNSDTSTFVKAYRRYKRRTTEHNTSNSGNALQDIIQDVQFCGMYFCGGILVANDDTLNENKNHEEEHQANEDSMFSKEERRKEMDDTFLGKMIQCGNIHDSCGNGDYICTPRRDEEEERDDWSKLKKSVVISPFK